MTNLRQLTLDELKPGLDVVYLMPGGNGPRPRWENAECFVVKVNPKTVEIKISTHDGRTFYRLVKATSLWTTETDLALATQGERGARHG